MTDSITPATIAALREWARTWDSSYQPVQGKQIIALCDERDAANQRAAEAEARAAEIAAMREVIQKARELVSQDGEMFRDFLHRVVALRDALAATGAERDAERAALERAALAAGREAIAAWRIKAVLIRNDKYGDAYDDAPMYAFSEAMYALEELAARDVSGPQGAT